MLGVCTWGKDFLEVANRCLKSYSSIMDRLSSMFIASWNKPVAT
jgi:hypothetical protein